MEALVYKSTGSWYELTDSTGQKWKARMKGAFKIDDISSTNPIAVGDRVAIVPESETDQTAIITEILERENYVARQSPQSRRRHHIVASNLDQSLLIATIREPRTSQGFIDRFLVACEAYHVPAVLLFNKSDTWKPRDREVFENWRDMYEAVGYRVLSCSVHQREGLDELRDLLSGKTTLLSGHSGVGKSSVLNVLFPGMNLRTGDVSGWSGKGMHTTTFAEMFDLPFGGRVIDTPGVREFGIVDIARDELGQYFPEIRQHLQDCQFNNCQHLHEPGCAVKQAVEEGAISVDRYASYLTIRDSIEENPY